MNYITVRGQGKGQMHVVDKNEAKSKLLFEMSRHLRGRCLA